VTPETKGKDVKPNKIVNFTPFVYTSGITSHRGASPEAGESQ
jgi:hypothetical protein